MSKFFKSKEQYEIQKKKNATRNHRNRRKARKELEKKLLPLAKERAAISKLADSLAQLVIKKGE